MIRLLLGLALGLLLAALALLAPGCPGYPYIAIP
jgi:hypothetical protein